MLRTARNIRMIYLLLLKRAARLLKKSSGWPRILLSPVQSAIWVYSFDRSTDSLPILLRFTDLFFSLPPPCPTLSPSLKEFWNPQQAQLGNQRGIGKNQLQAMGSTSKASLDTSTSCSASSEGAPLFYFLISPVRKNLCWWVICGHRCLKHLYEEKDRLMPLAQPACSGLKRGQEDDKNTKA